MASIQELSPEELFGIAKRMDRELQALPLHTHSAIVEMVRVGVQHRNLQLQAADNQEKKDQQERVLKIQEHQMAMQQEQARRVNAGSLVEHPPN